MSWKISQILQNALGELPKLIADAEATNASGPDKKIQVLGAIANLVGDADVAIGADHPLVQGAIGVAIDALVNVIKLSSEVVAQRGGTTAPPAPTSNAQQPPTDVPAQQPPPAGSSGGRTSGKKSGATPSSEVEEGAEIN